MRLTNAVGAHLLSAIKTTIVARAQKSYVMKKPFHTKNNRHIRGAKYMCWSKSPVKRYENDQPMMLDSENQGVTGHKE